MLSKSFFSTPYLLLNSLQSIILHLIEKLGKHSPKY